MSIYQDILDQLQPLQPLPAALSPRTRAFPDCKAMMFDIYGTLLISASGDIGHQEMGVEAMAQALRHLTSLASPIDPKQASCGTNTILSKLTPVSNNEVLLTLKLIS
ncbi:hypothetical protein [Candidatus Entotheonella palauensis]|uniref:hypothetical protein n=1 Tax=Candidatus Entotheonella palauensis TaxID=93172 RepID=UPI000B7E8E9E|nr:hypothetical protein [Candidatus Entotheonella palauensis]